MYECRLLNVLTINSYAYNHSRVVVICKWNEMRNAKWSMMKGEKKNGERKVKNLITNPCSFLQIGSFIRKERKQSRPEFCMHVWCICIWLRVCAMRYQQIVCIFILFLHVWMEMISLLRSSRAYNAVSNTF